MKRPVFLTITMGALVLGGLLTAGCGSGDESAVAQGVPTDLSGVTQNWNKNLPAAQRFVVLSSFNNAAVLDKNTGLVWEKAPDATRFTWHQARLHCVNRNVGGTVGWRLPSVVELKSVQDPSLPPPFVPASVFTGVQSDFYWSASTFAEAPTLAWYVGFGLGGSVGGAIKSSNLHRAWCVRGGMNADAY